MEIKSTKSVESQNVKVLVYGNAGAGKTYLCSTINEPALIISAESGLLSLNKFDIDYVSVNSVKDVLDVFNYLAKDSDGGKYKWVCLDSLSEIAEVILADEKKKEKDPRKAYGTMIDRMTALIRHFRDLRRNIYMTAKVDRVRDDVTGSVLWSPSMPGSKLAQSLPFYFDEVFAYRHIQNESGESKRFLQTVSCSQYLAKDRSGCLNNYEEPNLCNIYNKIKGLKKGE